MLVAEVLLRKSHQSVNCREKITSAIQDVHDMAFYGNSTYDGELEKFVLF